MGKGKMVDVLWIGVFQEALVQLVSIPTCRTSRQMEGV